MAVTVTYSCTCNHCGKTGTVSEDNKEQWVPFDSNGIMDLELTASVVGSEGRGVLCPTCYSEYEKYLEDSETALAAAAEYIYIDAPDGEIDPDEDTSGTEEDDGNDDDYTDYSSEGTLESPFEFADGVTCEVGYYYAVDETESDVTVTNVYLFDPSDGLDAAFDSWNVAKASGSFTLVTETTA
jgi:hypothetical protein